MSWQKKARLGIAVFVVVFIVVVAVALRQRRPAAPKTPLPVRTDPASLAEVHGGATHELTNKEGETTYRLQSTSEFVYPDGRAVVRGVTLTLPDRGGRSIVITAKELENTAAKGQTIGVAHLTGDVHVKTSDGIEIRSDEASYDQAAGLLTVPGQVDFTRGRMTGSGLGATYDRDRAVLWLNQRAHVTVTPDAAGQGAMDATAASIGMARADHYVRLREKAHIDADGRQMEADDIAILLTPDDERVRAIELRVNSRITGGGAQGAPQTMAARDIDLTYGENGRTLQQAHLTDNAVVQLPGEGQAPGKRVSGRTIDIAMAPDGETVTSLEAAESVQLDLPADGDTPARRIRSATLAAGGGDRGLQTATFAGGVDYRETRAARRALPAVNRTARSTSLLVHTQPGLGALEQADFSGNVHIDDGTGVTAEAPHVVYHVTRDQMDLSPGEAGEAGPAPHVSDTRVSVDARTISVTLGTRRLSAETRVRSSMLPQSKAAAPAARGTAPASAASRTRVPSMLEQDQPVNVTSNRLAYDGDAGHATYTGNARLWQADTSVSADTIVVDDSTGNLEADGSVRTTMLLEEPGAKPAAGATPPTIGTSDTFLYDDAKRLATYTGHAHIAGTERDVTGDRIELFLEPEQNELQRAEAYDNVRVKESATDRTATGNRLTYTAATEVYFMTGTPVVVIQKSATDCKQTTASSVRFRQAVDTVDAGGVGPLPLKTTACVASGAR